MASKLAVPLTTPGAAAGFSSLAAVVTAYLSGKSLLVSFQTAAPQTLRVSHGAFILSDRSDKSDKSDTSATPPQHAYPVAIKKTSHTPTAHLCPCHSKQRHSTPGVSHGLPLRSPSGRRRAAPNLSDRSDMSDRSDTSASPPPAHHRCHIGLAAYQSPEPPLNHTAFFTLKKSGRCGHKVKTLL